MRLLLLCREVLTGVLSSSVIPVLIFASMKQLKPLRTHLIGLKGFYYLQSSLPQKYFNFLRLLNF